LLLSLMMTAAATSPTAAFVVDGADLLTDIEQADLESQLDAIQQTHQMNVMVVTAESTEGMTPEAYAVQCYNNYVGADKDGVLLLLSMEERDWWILPNGACEAMFDGDDIESIGELMVVDLSAGDYAAGFSTFAEECEYIINGELNGYPFPFGMTLLVSLGVGFVVALIVVGIMRGQLKSVRSQAAANQYVKAGSMQVTASNEFFLYRTVHRTKKQTQSSSGGSSSGSRGGGGKF